MRTTLDLLYASDSESPWHAGAKIVPVHRAADPDVFCISWLTLMGYQRMATHPGIFASPLAPAKAWANVRSILGLPRIQVIGEESSFAEDYESAASAFPIRGNLVPDGHLAVILREHGVGRLYTTDTDFRSSASWKSSIRSGGRTLTGGRFSGRPQSLRLKSTVIVVTTSVGWPLRR